VSTRARVLGPGRRGRPGWLQIGFAALLALALAEPVLGQPPARSRIGVVASAAPEASEAGARILRMGGNAVDAAVATAFALAVVYPQAGNLAGGGFLVLRTASGEEHALDFRETAPSGVSPASFQRRDGSIRAGASLASGLAVGTPGTVRGLQEVHRRFGKVAWESLLAPAIEIATKGFVVPPKLVADLAAEKELLIRTEATRKLFFPDGRPLVAGQTFRQPHLAATLAAIARGGADAFHLGPVAERIAAAVRADGGVLLAEDMAGYRPVWRPPFVIDHGRWRLVTIPPPSAGGFVLASVLAQLRSAADGEPGPARAIHMLAEAERRAYADRNAVMGDPDCVGIPLARLLLPARLAALGASIDPGRATLSAGILGGGPRATEREETTHLSVATSDGAAVSLTYTLNGSFGNGMVVDRLGFLLNNEMDDFAIAPGRPNLYGLIQGESNAVRAGARPVSSMTPTLVLESGRLRFVLGSPGGSTIPTTVLQVFLAAGPRGRPLAEAVAAPRFHHQHLPDRIFVEREAFAPEVRSALEKLGHQLEERPAIGLVHAISLEPDGTLLGVADPRGYGRASAAEEAPAQGPRNPL